MFVVLWEHGEPPLHEGKEQHKATSDEFGFASSSFKEEEEPHAAGVATEKNSFAASPSGTSVSGFRRAMARDHTQHLCWRTWQSGQKRGTRTMGDHLPLLPFRCASTIVVTRKDKQDGRSRRSTTWAVS